MLLEVKFLGDASKNCLAWVRGSVEEQDTECMFEVICLDDIASTAHGRRPKSLTLTSALWLLEEKLGLRVWLSKDASPENLLLLMESRNFIRIDRGITLENWQGKIYVQPFNIPFRKWFWFQLDFDKVLER